MSIKNVQRILNIFSTSEGSIRPHFILTGPSGSGKSHTIETLCNHIELPVISINAASITKEGTSGNSLSKALSPILQYQNTPVVCFVDEFDKLFISGNSNSQLAHEVTHGVQNEFLRVLEGKASVFGDYGKYINTSTENVLFVFAGAFNGEEDIDLDRLREFGVKTEFLGRVGLTYSMPKVSLDEMEKILKESTLLESYLALIPSETKEKVVDILMYSIIENYDKNTLGVRMINTLIHQYFIEGNETKDSPKRVTFQKTLEMVN